MVNAGTRETKEGVLPPAPVADLSIEQPVDLGGFSWRRAIRSGIDAGLGMYLSMRGLSYIATGSLDYEIKPVAMLSGATGLAVALIGGVAEGNLPRVGRAVRGFVEGLGGCVVAGEVGITVGRLAEQIGFERMEVLPSDARFFSLTAGIAVGIALGVWDSRRS